MGDSTPSTSRPSSAGTAPPHAGPAGHAGSLASRARVEGVVAVLCLVSLPLVLGGLSLHASAARREKLGARPATLAVVRRLPSADFAFAGGSRHLRFVSLEEPQAAFADGPCLPDPDPAGGLVGAPKAAYADVPVRALASPPSQGKGAR